MQVSVTGLNLGFKLGDKGILAGTHELANREGHYIGRFNIFAAAEDLNVNASGTRTLLTFKNTAIELAERKIWLGHESCKLDFEHYEEQLLKGLKDGSTVGKWFIPTREMLCGRNADGKNVWSENLYDLKNAGDFNKTFTTGSALTTVSGSSLAHWYWSSTEHRDSADCVYAVDFTDGDASWGGHKDGNCLSCRPCRVELVI
jgi:hypothetical protein